MEERIYVLMVIYQKNGEQSAACRALREAAWPYVLLVDNSTRDFDNAAYCAATGWDYVSMNGNQGLPKAYNRGVELLKNKADVLVLLDDDTRLTADYFAALAAARAAHPEGRVFLPTVYDGVGLLSPCRTKGRGFARASAPTDIPADELTAINSGMAIDRRVFDAYRYDERYFLDFVDHAFMRDMRAGGVPVVCFDAVLRQQFSGSEAYHAQSAKTRFRLFRRDGARYYGASVSGRLYYPLAMARRWLSLKKQALAAAGNAATTKGEE